MKTKQTFMKTEEKNEKEQNRKVEYCASAEDHTWSYKKLENFAAEAMLEEAES